MEISENMAVPPTAPVSCPVVAEPDKSSSVPKAAIDGRTRLAKAHRKLERTVGLFFISIIIFIDDIDDADEAKPMPTPGVSLQLAENQ